MAITLANKRPRANLLRVPEHPGSRRHPPGLPTEGGIKGTPQLDAAHTPSFSLFHPFLPFFAEASAPGSQDRTLAVMRYADSCQRLPESDAARGEYPRRHRFGALMAQRCSSRGWVGRVGQGRLRYSLGPCGRFLMVTFFLFLNGPPTHLPTLSVPSL